MDNTRVLIVGDNPALLSTVHNDIPNPNSAGQSRVPANSDERDLVRTTLSPMDKERVLVVDDDPEALALLRALSESHGFAVHTASEEIVVR